MVSVYNDRYRTIITYLDNYGIEIIASTTYSAYDGYDGALNSMKPWTKKSTSNDFYRRRRL